MELLLIHLKVSFFQFSFNFILNEILSIEIELEWILSECHNKGKYSVRFYSYS